MHRELDELRRARAMAASEADRLREAVRALEASNDSASRSLQELATSSRSELEQARRAVEAATSTAARDREALMAELSTLRANTTVGNQRYELLETESRRREVICHGDDRCVLDASA